MVRELVHPRQQSIVPRTAVADGEGLDHGSPFGVDDARHMAALGDVNSNDEHKANTILSEFADSPPALMSHSLLQDQRKAAAPASGSTMNSHKIEAPYCIERTCAAWIKKGTSVCGEQYITAASGEDTKAFSRCILDAYSCRFALFESIAG